MNQRRDGSVPNDWFPETIPDPAGADAADRGEDVPRGPDVRAGEFDGAPAGSGEWMERIDVEFGKAGGKPFELAERALAQAPDDDRVLHLAALAATFEGKSDVGLRYLTRLHKRYFRWESTAACEAIVLAQLGRWPQARDLVDRYSLTASGAYLLFPPNALSWGAQWLGRIRRWRPVVAERDKDRAARKTPKARAPAAAPPAAAPPPVPPAGPLAAPPSPLPRVSARMAVACTLPGPGEFAVLDRGDPDGREEFLLRHDLSRLALLRGFDELLCLPHLAGVRHYWYQIETVRKVLKHFRGRVLLADEVGLGKTIEAGMILKEYLLRGMVERVLILVPPSLVGQWGEELCTKFGVDMATTHDPLLRRDPEAFWSRPRILASIATARTGRNAELIGGQAFDIVIVDEAHHVKNRSSRNWQLVDGLKKRFLLLLSATPVQNNLVELYNLLTLLKPGVFKTEKDFRARYVTPGQPRAPLNPSQLRNLMRDAMIRNTRALVDVRLPPRQVLTLRVDPTPEEQDCYAELCRLLRGARRDGAAGRRLALQHALEAAGSSPAAAALSLDPFIRDGAPDEWRQVRDRYAALGGGAKLGALKELLDRNPAEKKMVFVRYLETLRLLDRALRESGVPFARYDGSLSGPEKDQAIERFRADASVLLCTESGGEGRNVQFCNTLINFDLHWNPQVIEQRIGRVHRIGQEREVFVFNLAVRETVEDRILAILDEKINMFELVVGEIQSILGEMDEDREFADLVFSAWLEETENARDEAFERIGRQLIDAKGRYDEAKAYDEDLFGDEFEVV